MMRVLTKRCHYGGRACGDSWKGWKRGPCGNHAGTALPGLGSSSCLSQPIINVMLLSFSFRVTAWRSCDFTVVEVVSGMAAYLRLQCFFFFSKSEHVVLSRNFRKCLVTVTAGIACVSIEQHEGFTFFLILSMEASLIRVFSLERPGCRISLSRST